VRGGLRRINDGDVGGRDAAQHRLDERVVGAAEDKDVGIVGLGRKGVRQIDLCNLDRHRMIDPSFFNKRHKERTSFLSYNYISSFQRAAVGVAGGGRFGADHDNLTIKAGRGRGRGAGFDYANDLDVRSSFDFREGKGRSGIAGDDKKLGAMRLEVANRSNCVMGDSGGGLGSVGQAGCVAEIEIVGVGNAMKKCRKNCEAAYAGIEDADGWPTNVRPASVGLFGQSSAFRCRRTDDGTDR
jgi:hypothetical protein